MGEEILHCPRCGEVMLHQELDFWTCPRCGGEFWPPDEPEENDRAQIRACWEEDVKIPLIKKRRGNRSGKRRGRKPWKPLPSERYILV